MAYCNIDLLLIEFDSIKGNDSMTSILAIRHLNLGHLLSTDHLLKFKKIVANQRIVLRPFCVCCTRCQPVCREPSLIKDKDIRFRKLYLRYFSGSVHTNMAAEGVYGSWKSPISSQLATQSAVGFQELHLDRAPGKGGQIMQL